jgi:hypothetical protein
VARFVTSSEEFAALLESRRRLLYDDVVLPGNVFKAEYRFFRVVDEAYVLSDELIAPLQEFSRYLGLHQIAIMTIAPDPRQFLQWAGRYGVIVFDCEDIPDEVVALGWKPSGACAFPVIVEKLAVFPLSSETAPWGVYRDRYHCEAGIIGFQSRDVAKRFIEMDRGGSNITVEPEIAIETFMTLSFRDFVLPVGFKEEFLANYGGGQDRADKT